MRTLFIILLSVFTLSSRTWALSIAGPPPEHDWTVRVGYRHYGIGGDSRGSYISYGSDFMWVRLSFSQLVSVASLSALAIGAGVWFIVRRREHATA